jgi:chromosome segregation ATPase
LLRRAEQVSGNPEIVRLKNELQDTAAKLSGRNAAKLKLASDVKTLQQKSLETSSQRETWDLEVRHMKLRTAEGLDGPQGLVSDDILVLQAEKQKWDLRVQALEEKMRTIAESDDTERQLETALIEEKKLKGRNIDDVQMQLQVIMEERDGLRDGMDFLWQEKTRADEELENVTEGYTHLSDRLFEKIEYNRELGDQVQEYENLLAMLRENFKRAQATMGSVQATSSPLRPPPAIPASPPAPGQAAGAPQGEDEEDPHYSEDEVDAASVSREAAVAKDAAPKVAGAAVAVAPVSGDAAGAKDEDEESNYSFQFEAPEPED